MYQRNEDSIDLSSTIRVSVSLCTSCFCMVLQENNIKPTMINTNLFIFLLVVNINFYFSLRELLASCKRAASSVHSRHELAARASV